MQENKLQNFDAFQDGTAEQYKELLSLYSLTQNEEELNFKSLTCESMKGIFYSKKYNDLRIGKFQIQNGLSFEDFKSKMINTFYQ